MYLFGASGHGKVIKEIVEADGNCVDAFVDDNLSIDVFCGRRVLHDATGLSPIIVSIGNNSVRKTIVDKLSCNFATAIHPSAIISPSATIDEGTVVMAGAILNADTVIGRHCIVNTGASVDHDCQIADFAHIAPHATLAGGVTVGECSWIGAGAVVKQYVNIGRNCIVGAGAVVLNDVPDGTTVVGVPARIIKTNNMCISNLQMGGVKPTQQLMLHNNGKGVYYAA